MLTKTQQLEGIIASIRSTREALAAKLAENAKNPNISESLRAHNAQKAKAAAADALAGLRGTADGLSATVSGYRPQAVADAAHEARVTRAAQRVTQLLDNGVPLGDVLRLAADNRDVAMVDAAREAAPTRIHLDVRGLGLAAVGEEASLLAEFNASADIAMARSLAGTPAGAEAVDMLTGRALSGVVAQEFRAAEAEAGGSPVNAMELSVNLHYARREYDAVAAQLAQPTDA